VIADHVLVGFVVATEQLSIPMKRNSDTIIDNLLTHPHCAPNPAKPFSSCVL
jgi:hypothetical protein